jgi:hypothetical protein
MKASRSLRSLAVVIALLSAAGVTAYAAQKQPGGGRATGQPPSIEGTYDCVGDAPGGGQYQGAVRITRSGDVYTLTWSIGGNEHSGIAFLDGDRLCNSWAVRAPSGEGFVTHGVVVYKVAGNRLEGRFLEYPGEGGVLKETLTRRGR